MKLHALVGLFDQIKGTELNSWPSQSYFFSSRISAKRGYVLSEVSKPPKTLSFNKKGKNQTRDKGMKAPISSGGKLMHLAPIVCRL